MSQPIIKIDCPGCQDPEAHHKTVKKWAEILGADEIHNRESGRVDTVKVRIGEKKFRISALRGYSDVQLMIEEGWE